MYTANIYLDAGNRVQGQSFVIGTILIFLLVDYIRRERKKEKEIK
jgi:hypothetical protein